MAQWLPDRRSMKSPSPCYFFRTANKSPAKSDDHKERFMGMIERNATTARKTTNAEVCSIWDPWVNKSGRLSEGICLNSGTEWGSMLISTIAGKKSGGRFQRAHSVIQQKNRLLFSLHPVSFRRDKSIFNWSFLWTIMVFDGATQTSRRWCGRYITSY